MGFRGLQRVIKVGNSLAVILPVEIARALEIQRGQAVGLSTTDPTFIIIKLIPEYDVERLRLKLPDVE